MLWTTDTECWECGRPGTYTGDYALCDHCSTDANRAKHEATAAAVYDARHKEELDRELGGSR